MGIYDKKSGVSKDELKSGFKGDSGRIPGTGGKSYSSSERYKIEKEVFGERYGDVVDRNEYRRAIGRLESKKNAARTPEEKTRIKQKIDYLKSVGGWRVR